MLRRRLHVLVLALWSTGLCMAHEGGCHGEPGATRPSPVNAIGMVLEHEDGSVDARLLVRSDTLATASPVAVSDVSLSRGGEWFALSGEEGHYQATIDGLLYEPEQPFTLGFVLDADTAGEHRVYAGRFAMSAHGPHERPEAWIEGQRELVWSPGGLSAYVEVRDAGGRRTWRSFDPFAASPDYEAMAPGGMTLPGEAFAGPGPHEVLVCAVEAMRRDELAAAPQHVTGDVDLEGQLGWLSGMVVGRCTTLRPSLE